MDFLKIWVKFMSVIDSFCGVFNKKEKSEYGKLNKNLKSDIVFIKNAIEIILHRIDKCGNDTEFYNYFITTTEKNETVYHIKMKCLKTGILDLAREEDYNISNNIYDIIKLYFSGILLSSDKKFLKSEFRVTNMRYYHIKL